MDFLKKDLPEVEKESKAFADCMIMATMHGYQKDYHQIAHYLESAARSARELARMKDNKRLDDEAWFLVKQIEAKKQQRELLHKLAVNIYE